MAELPSGAEVTWLGHATFVITTTEGERLLVDPWVMNNPACPVDQEILATLMRF